MGTIEIYSAILFMLKSWALILFSSKYFQFTQMKTKLALLPFTLLSFYFSFAQVKLDDLKIDTSITGFHFAADFQGTKVFTKNGPADLNTINPTAFSFTVAPNVTAEMAVEQLQQLMEMSKQNGYKVSNISKKDTTLQGNKAYYLSYTEAEDKTNYKNLVFNAFVVKGSTLILFVSGDLDNGRYIDQFRKTFYSIKL